MFKFDFKAHNKLRNLHVFFSIVIATIIITSSFQFPVLAQEIQILPLVQDLQFSSLQVKNNSGKANFVPGQLVVGLQKPDNNFNEKASLYGGQVIESLDQINAFVVKVPANAEETFIEAISKNPNVLYVEHDGVVNALDVPNDPLYPAQWGTKRIGMESVWSSNFAEGTGITIAVVDEGLYYNHPDFFGTTIRTDIDYDFVDNDYDTKPTTNCFSFQTLQYEAENHGTFVTGVIVSALNDNYGLSGVGKFDVLPIRALNECGGGSYSDVAQGIIYAADHGADVINLSLGSEYWEYSVLHDAIKYATGYPSEAVVVASSGNQGDSRTSYPAGFDEVISVGATAVDDTIASYSQYGPTLDLSAPGAEAPEGSCDFATMTYILTTGVHTTSGNTSPSNPAWEYYCVAGTSFASPYVSAVAGLVKAANQDPCISNEDIQLRLEQTAEDLGAPGWDPYFGYGLVRADMALSNPVIFHYCAPVITLNGTNPQIIGVGTPYSELGATALDADFGDGDLTDKIVIDSSAVDTSSPGSYNVTYDVTDSDGYAAAQVIRTVIVEGNTPPVITLVGNNPLIIEAAPLPSVYTEYGATAFDNEDGDITGNIVIDSSAVDTSSPGSYNVTYDVTDSDGYAAQVIRTVIVEDNTPPVITLIGNNPQVLEIDEAYVESGATAIDSLDGDISGNIDINATSVDASTVGDYFVTYDVMDAAGNPAQQVTRTVTVQNTSTSSPVVHVASLDGSVSGKKNLNYQVNITLDGDMASGVAVYGVWSNNPDPVSCQVDVVPGQCSVNQITKDIPPLTFSIIGLGNNVEYDESSSVTSIDIGQTDGGGGSGGGGQNCQPNNNSKKCQP